MLSRICYKIIMGRGWAKLTMGLWLLAPDGYPGIPYTIIPAFEYM